VSAPVRLAHPYAGATVALATKHGKQEAVGPALHATVGLAVVVAPGLDTDALGTFTGEVPRPGTPSQTALAKARLGMAALGLARGIASEGSFGPHPELGFVAAGVELLAFVDDELGIELVERRLSERTNFAHLQTRALDARARTFLERVGFPSHALIVRANHPEADVAAGLLFKGLTDLGGLKRAISQCAAASSDGQARLETDMRAHLNPTRMGEIAVLAAQLGRRLAHTCDACAAPGFGLIGVERGLPCCLCAEPTELAVCELHGCPRCGHTQRRPRADGRRCADPGCCAQCNP
jgi:hypothetical protein